MRIIKEVKEDWIYMQLHMFKQGHISPSEIKDDMIFQFRNNGIIVLQFENDYDYFSLFGFDKYKVRTLEGVFSYYSTYEWYERYTAEDDWREGYLYNYLNTENKEVLEEIKQYLAPELDLGENDDIVKFFSLLDETFRNWVDNIIDDYTSETDNAIQETIKKEVRNDLCDIFMSDGLYRTGDECFYKYYTTVDNLIKIYNKFDDKSLTIYEVLKELGESKNLEDFDYNDWYEYNYHDNFDDDNFNRSVNWNLEKIKDELLDSDKIKDIEEFKKIKETLNKYDFKFNVWYDLPKNQNMMFKIQGVDPETNKIIFEYKLRNTMDFKKGKLSLEKFNLFLYHPELF